MSHLYKKLLCQRRSWKLCVISIGIFLSVSSNSVAQVKWWALDNTMYCQPYGFSNGQFKGTPLGTPTYSSSDFKVGSHACVFNGIDDYIDVGYLSSASTGTQPFTLSAWAKTNTISGIHTVFNYGFGINSISIGQNGTSLTGGLDGAPLVVPNFWATGVWHLITLTTDGTTAYLYGDGILLTSGPVNWSIVLNNGYIGTSYSNKFWNGLIDDVRLLKGYVDSDGVLLIAGYATKLKGRWSFEQNGNDISGYNSLTTPLNNPSYSDNSRVGDYCIQLNGTNQYTSGLGVSQFPAGTSPRSISVWARTASTAAGPRTIVAYGSGTAGQNMYIGQNGTTLVAGSIGNDLSFANFWAPNVWHHLCLTYDGTTAKLYADGTLVVSANKTWTLVNSKSYCGRNANDTEYWNGLVDDIRTFSPALTAGEVKALSAVPAGTPATPSTSTTVSSINLTWTDNLSNETFYEVQRSTVSTGPFKNIVMLPANSTSYADVNLQDGTMYYYRIRGSNKNGKSEFSPVVAISTMSAAPVSFVVSATGSSTALSLEWLDNSRNETGFQVERATAVGGPFTLVTTTATNETSYLNTGLTVGTTYYYRIRSICPGNNSVYVNSTGAATLTAAKELQYQQNVANLAFQYQYDTRHRMIAKKVPGADWVYMVYDDHDRLVLTQDGNQRSTATKYWTFTKYDELNRPILTGIKDTAAALSQLQMQGVVDTYYSLVSTTKPWRKYGEKFIGAAAANNVHGYTNYSYPQVTTTSTLNAGSYLTATYYDNYTFRNDWPGSYTYVSDALTQTSLTGTYTQLATGLENQLLLGQITGTKIKVMDGGVTGGNTWLKGISYYDDKYRVIQIVADNYKGGEDRTSNLYDFAGKVLKTKTTHVERDVTWTGLVNVQQTGNILKSTTAAAGAASVQILPAGQDGWMEFTYVPHTGARYIGFNDTNPDALGTNINYAFKFVTNTVTIVENNGTAKATLTGLVAGEILRIQRAGTVIKFYRNGLEITLGSAATASSTQLMVDVSFGTTAIAFTGVKASFGSASTGVIRRFDYDHAGRLLKTFHLLGTNPEVLLTQNEYNELGQLVDKKLHSVSGSAPKQSVDYRYNIRGWLTSMNNASLTTGSNNDETNDLFGFELGYDNSLGTGNTPLYNGNISGMKWSNNLALGTVKEKAYSYSYDAMNRIAGAMFKEKRTAWSASSSNGFSEKGYAYDLNGNIQKLVRYDERGYGTRMDSLVYDYGTGNTFSNKLLKVTDNGDDFKGFVDGTNAGNDYTYDLNGNMTTDQNKGITTAITYNYLNLPELVTKGGNTIQYIYDAGGRKLAQVTNFSGVQKQTDYAGEFQYENDVLQNVQHEEGRIVLMTPALVAFHHGEISTDLSASNVTLATATLNGTEKYVSATATGTVARSGITAIGAPVVVVAGERYRVRVKGYRVKGSSASTNPVYLSIKGNGTDINWPGAALPTSGLTESWAEQIITVPTGVTQLTVGLNWNTVTVGEIIYLNELEVTRETTQAAEYQYFLKDHLGNVRLTFTSKAPVTTSYTTNFESATNPDFENYSSNTFDLVDHTDAAGTVYQKVQLLNGGSNGRVGIAKSIPVMAGDEITAQAYVKYMNLSTSSNPNIFINSLANAFGVSSSSTGEQLKVYNGLNNFAGTVPAGDHYQDDESAPKAFVTILFFDKDYNFVDAAWDQVSTTGAQTSATVKQPPHDLITITKKSPIQGYAFIFFSNEHPNYVDVYFDDASVSVTPSPVVSMDDYYPFGLTFNSYSRENSVDQKYTYNGKEEQDELGLGWLDFGRRMYQPDIGRFMVHDRFTEKFFMLSPYQFAANNPLSFIDINGDSIVNITRSGQNIAIENSPSEEGGENFTNTITLESDVSMEDVSDYSAGIVNDAMVAIGDNSVVVSSGTRTPEQQADAMYFNLETGTVAGEKKTYGPGGDKVIDTYVQAKAETKEVTNSCGEVSCVPNYSPSQIKQKMVDKINQVGPSKVSDHTVGDRSKMNVFDIKPSTVSDPTKFHNKLSGDTRVKQVLSKVNKPAEKAIHIEILQKK
jgi:RHS repeat-associated protein